MSQIAIIENDKRSTRSKLSLLMTHCKQIIIGKYPWRMMLQPLALVAQLDRASAF